MFLWKNKEMVFLLHLSMTDPNVLVVVTARYQNLTVERYQILP